MQHQSTPAKLGQGSVQSDPLTWSECELIVAFYAAGVETSWRSWEGERLTGALEEQRTKLGVELLSQVAARYEAAREKDGGWVEIRELCPDRERVNAAMWLAEEYADIVGTQLSDASRWAELCSVDECFRSGAAGGGLMATPVPQRIPAVPRVSRVGGNRSS